MFDFFDQKIKTKRQIVYALQSEVFKNPALLRRRAFISDGIHVKLRIVIFNRHFGSNFREKLYSGEAVENTIKSLS